MPNQRLFKHYVIVLDMAPGAPLEREAPQPSRVVGVTLAIRHESLARSVMQIPQLAPLSLPQSPLRF